MEASPPVSYTHLAVYALSVSAPSFRMGEEAIAHCADLLLGIQPRIEQVLKNA